MTDPEPFAFTKLVLAVGGVCALLVVAGLWVFGSGGDDHASPASPPGSNAPAFPSAEALLMALRASGVNCVDPQPFDPSGNIAADGGDDPRPDAVVCAVDDAALYVLVYEKQEHRIQALEHGEVQLNLCQFAAFPQDPDGEWASVVGANWRIATPQATPVLDAVQRSVSGAALEPVSCRPEY